MKKSFVITALLCSLTFPFQTRAGSPSPESQPESRPVPSTSMVDEALTLVEIYGKVRRIIGKDDRSELKVQLDRLNGALDEILYFKNSFTPKKLERIEQQMGRVKADAAGLIGQDVDGARKQFLRLSDSLLELVKSLMEPAPENRL